MMSTSYTKAPPRCCLETRWVRAEPGQTLKPAEQQRFVDLGLARRIWAIGAVHGDGPALAALHDALGGHFRPGDRLAYLGNFGLGGAFASALDELIGFRAWLISQRGVLAGDLVYLRGAHEEMLQKAMQLQFAPDPQAVLAWMFRRGLDATLAGYGVSPREGELAARAGALSLTKWSSTIKAAVRARPGHHQFMLRLRRAAYVYAEAGGLLLVSANVDPSRPLAAQGDALWWGGSPFHTPDAPYEGFARVVRGWDAGGGGYQSGHHRTTVESGEPRAVLFDEAGAIQAVIGP